MGVGTQRVDRIPSLADVREARDAVAKMISMAASVKLAPDFTAKLANVQRCLALLENLVEQDRVHDR